MPSHRGARCLVQIQRQAANRISHILRNPPSRTIIPSSPNPLLNPAQRRFLSQTRLCQAQSAAQGNSDEPKHSNDSSTSTPNPRNSRDVLSDFTFSRSSGPVTSSPSWTQPRRSDTPHVSIAEGMRSRLRKSQRDPHDLTADFAALRRAVPASASAPFPHSATEVEERTVRTNPTVGRSIKVQRENVGLKGDVAYAIRNLDMTLRRNKVKTDMHRQKFHERPGLKRKRVARESWRRRFSKEFELMVKRVQELRTKGW
ncbi:hypothetical protein P152DRAFT_457605 [Eremomyces bilateralis CBS 781.70]|uniref:Ribosomal protein S21 n=1 Tax=Eremomyces bilateralis CBS 781.70 TaxID=1392243 RepID=A0A6G1G5A6_9PEZI|nr:uncharacterized protein P152DRAFT_457605 [Eremomyces bilateralis CBS 781.70]KAF1813243.1 hypothetical protein P152DRAFT_457605 [Eremomyces bilateralis CBS 781.70]